MTTTTTITRRKSTRETVTIDHVSRVPIRETSIVDIIGPETFKVLESRGVGARGRCQNPDDKDYRRYGGRGIEFRFSSILDFIVHMHFVVGYKQGDTRTIDRIDNDGHYEAGNLRLATKLEQTHNRSKPMTTLNGEVISCKDLEKEMKRRGLHMLRGGINALADLGYTGESIIKIAMMDI